MLLDEHTLQIAELPDEVILERSIAHPGLFAVLVERYQDAFLRKAESVIHSREEAEDIVQETFTKIYFNARRFKTVEGASFKSWGYKILVNTTFTHYQKLKKKGALHVELEPEFYETLPDPANRRDDEVLRDYVASFLSQMPAQLVRPLRLHFLEDYSQKEIADMEGSTVSAVKTKIYRAKREFERLLARDETKLQNTQNIQNIKRQNI
jgi:RNA polymerase sigma-70 factor (ECF subfamily)